MMHFIYNHDFDHIFLLVSKLGLQKKMHWDKLSLSDINTQINHALGINKNFKTNKILGVPASYLDEKQFYDDAPFLATAPFLKTLVANPNHIGCHTLNENAEPFFRGTQKIEQELIKLCAEEILGGDKDMQDGYVTSGGTEANIQALWIYRNYFVSEYNAKNDEIAIVYSADSHYSLPKGANILNLQSIVLRVDDSTRMILQEELERKLIKAQENGIKYFIVVMNLATTMFGSIDDIVRVTDYFKNNNLLFKLHVDGAFGGFIYPFTNNSSTYTFNNDCITSFTLDGHKMLQSPYGTGIFIIRKGFMKYVLTNEANYIQGKDCTICGSRSGANAVALWMILKIHGSDGLKMKMKHLLNKSNSFSIKLKKLQIPYYHNPFINIVTIRAEYIPLQLANKFSLIPDSHIGGPTWYKIVVMEHVKQEELDELIMDLQVITKLTLQ